MLGQRADEKVGRIYDINTNARPDENKQGTEERIQNDGIDKLESGFSRSAGLPSGFSEETLDVVEDDNTPGQRIFLTKEV